MLTVQANGLCHAFITRGEGPLLLLLHGFPETAHGWLPVMEHLAAAGYRTVAPNLRGYPPTDLARDDDYSLVAGARDALALIEALGASRAAVIGLDWGALIAYTAANLDPDRVWKVAAGSAVHLHCFKLSDARVMWRGRHAVVNQLRGIGEWIIRRNDFAYVDRLYQRWSPSWNPGPEESAAVKAAFRTRGGLNGALGFYRCLAKTLVWPSQAGERRIVRQRTSVPALSFAGRMDGVLHVRQFREHQRAFAGPNRMLWFQGAGHFVHRERPAELAAALMDFLGLATEAPR